MKKIFILGLCVFLSFDSLAQKDKEWEITYENNFSKFRIDYVDFQASIKGYKELPSYFNDFDEPYTSQSKYYIHDSLVREDLETQHNPYKTVYFRSNHFGIGTNLYTGKYLDISHSVGMELSRADIDYGTIRSDYEYKDISENKYESITVTKSKSIASFKKIRRLGLSYENEIKLKPTKRLRLALGVRQQVYLKHTDHLLTSYSSYVDTLGLYNNYWFCGTEYFPSGLFRTLSQINLYHKYEPIVNYETTKRSMTLQYDMTIFVRPEVLIGKAQKSSLYCNIGITPLRIYGKDFVPSTNPVWYGFGISHKI